MEHIFLWVPALRKLSWQRRCRCCTQRSALQQDTNPGAYLLLTVLGVW